MAAHALDGQMRLAGIGGTQHGSDGRTGELGHDPLYVGDGCGKGKGKWADSPLMTNLQLLNG
jgi:hypothetical protein